MWNPLKYRWNKTDDEILPVFAQFFWTLEFIFSSSPGKLFPVLLGNYLFHGFYSFRKCKNSSIILVQGFCLLTGDMSC